MKARGKEWFAKHVKDYCLGLVVLLSALIFVTALVQIFCFPEVRLHVRTYYCIVGFFFFVGVADFVFYAWGKEPLSWKIFLVLTMSLSAVGVAFLPVCAPLFFGQMMAFCLAEILYNAWFYRRIRQ